MAKRQINSGYCMSLAEIAEVLGAEEGRRPSVQAVSSIIARGLSKLERGLAERGFTADDLRPEPSQHDARVEPPTNPR